MASERMRTQLLRLLDLPYFSKRKTITGERMELSDAFIITVKKDKEKILKAFVAKDITPFAFDKITRLKAGASSLGETLQSYGEEIKEHGLKDTVAHTSKDFYETILCKVKNTPAEITAAIATLKETPSRCRNGIKEFWRQIEEDLSDKESDKERTLYVLTLLSYATVFLVSAYGGYKIPDKDIEMFGIGKHRHFLTHSVVPAILIALLAKLLLRLIDEVALKVNDAGKKPLVIIKNHLKILVGGLAVGMAAHLLEDGILEPSGTIRGPGFNTIISGTTLDDQAYLVVNALFSAVLGEKAVSDIK